MLQSFSPNFRTECRVCGTVPTVIVVGHAQPYTELCGACFFNNRLMIDWEEWNNEENDE